MATSTADKDQSTGVIPGEWHVRYNYSVGKVAGKYFDGLKARKILATRCNKSGLTYLPPREPAILGDVWQQVLQK